MTGRLPLLLAALAILALSACAPPFKNVQHHPSYYYPIEVKIKALQSKYRSKGPIKLRFYVKNKSEIPVKLIRYNSPLEGKWRSEYFAVYRKKEAVPIRKDKLDTSRSGGAEFLLLYPGETIYKDVDLKEVYSFKKSGTYYVQFRGSDTGQLPDSYIVKFKVTN